MYSSEDDNIKLFRTIFEQTPVSTQVFNPKGETLFVNRAWEKLWNVTLDQIKSYNILKDKQLVETGIMPLIVRGFKGEIVDLPAIRYDPSKTIKIKNTITRWLSARMYPIKNNTNTITHIVLQHEDITERKQFEEGLAESRERLKATWEAATNAMVLSDPEGIVIEANAAYYNLYGYTPDEVIGKSFSIIFPRKVRKWAIEAYKTTFKDPRNTSAVESLVISKTGQKHFVESRYSFLLKGKTRIAMLSVIRDISMQKKSEIALRESEERLRIALYAGKIGVWDWDIVNNQLTWTDNVYTIHGVKKDTFKVTFNNFFKLIYTPDKAYVRKLISKTLRDGTPFSVEFRISTKEGIRWVTTNAVLIYEAPNKPIRMLGATSDITQQKQIEQDKSDFLSMAAHELKTPITSMKMFVELLHNSLKRSHPEKSLYLAKRIMDQTDRLTELTNDLLDVSRIETGKLKLNKEEVDLSQLIKDTVEGLQATTKHKIVIKTEGEHYSLLIDKFRIYQVLVNLITNAIKYSSVKKKILIAVTKKDNEVIIKVKDYGIGIANSMQKRIFDRLYQVVDSKSKTYPGLGLGLYISKEIIGRHNGKIWLKSRKGKGSEFYFSLPF